MKTLCVLIILLAFTKISLQGCFEMRNGESLPYNIRIRSRVKGWLNQGSLMYFGKGMDRSTFLNGDDADFFVLSVGNLARLLGYRGTTDDSRDAFSNPFSSWSKLFSFLNCKRPLSVQLHSLLEFGVRFSRGFRERISILAR